jgi:hypothetical protein
MRVVGQAKKNTRKSQKVSKSMAAATLTKKEDE